MRLEETKQTHAPRPDNDVTDREVHLPHLCWLGVCHGPVYWPAGWHVTRTWSCHHCSHAPPPARLSYDSHGRWRRCWGCSLGGRCACSRWCPGCHCCVCGPGSHRWMACLWAQHGWHLSFCCTQSWVMYSEMARRDCVHYFFLLCSFRS